VADAIKKNWPSLLLTLFITLGGVIWTIGLIDKRTEVTQAEQRHLNLALNELKEDMRSTRKEMTEEMKGQRKDLEEIKNLLMTKRQLDDLKNMLLGSGMAKNGKVFIP
jgi:signal transduction protein with GAF and PtsI domain